MVEALSARISVVQYDLTDTAFATAPQGAAIPSEAELSALTMAMLVATHSAFSELADHELVLSDDMLVAVGGLLDGPLSALARDFGGSRDARMRLREFVGLRVRAFDPNESPFI